MRLHCSLIGWFESHQFENAKKFLVDQQQSGENMSTGQIFCQDHGHEQVLLVSFDDFFRFYRGTEIRSFIKTIFS